MWRRGFTLVETLITIVIVGILMGIALPRFRMASTKNNLRGSRNTLTSLFAQARLTAIQQRRFATLRVEDNRVFVTAEPRLIPSGTSQYDTVGRVRDLSSEFGVTLTAPTTPIRIDPRGIALNVGTIRASKGSYTDSMQIDHYGRLRK